MTTTYTTDLGNGQQIYLENQGMQTLLTLMSATPGQQQSQQTGFPTGQWIAPPTLFRSPLGIVVKIDAEQGQVYLKVQASGMQQLQQAPTLSDATVLPVQPVTSPPQPPMTPMQPMQPMQPMKMGNMEMQMNPMQMRMGDMEMQMGEAFPTPPAPPAATQRFCTQCGRAVALGDRFCSQCGNPLHTS